MHRPLGMLLAAALTVATIGGASAANAAQPADTSAALTMAAAGARANASAALGGIALPSGSAAHLRAAAAKTHVESVHLTVPVKVAAKRYDIRVTSVGPKSDATRIRLYAGAQSTRIAVRRLVRIVVHPHGSDATTLATTTTFRRFVVMLTHLQKTPLLGEQQHFASRASLVAALSHGLAIGAGEVTREYGAVIRLAQMSLDLAFTLVSGLKYRAEHPSAADLSAVPTTHTTAGSGGYAGEVTLTGTADTFSATATNTTDDSSLTEAFTETAVTITYTVHGVSSTVSF